MPLILGTNSIKDVGYEVANSLRFNSGSSDTLSRTFGTATSQKKFTWSLWWKKTKIATNMYIFENTGNASSQGSFVITNTDKIVIFDETNGSLVETSAVYRDPSAWMHIVMRLDTTQSTASDRVRIYINGVQQSLGGTQPSQNTDYPLLSSSGSVGTIGKYDNNTAFLDGYLCEVVFCDGQSLDPTSFGEFDSDTNIWKPIDVSGLTFGNNGFYLDFENSGSLGADVSGNGNNFTVNNLTSIDQTTDTCTNNFNVLNTIHPTAANFTISEGATKISKSGSSHNNGGYLGTLMPTASGKWYFEAKIDEAGNGDRGRIGLANYESVTGTDTMQTMSNVSGLEVSLKSAKLFVTVNGTTTEHTSSGDFSDGDIIQIAMDLDNKAIYVGRNGTYLTLSGSSGGDPTSGSSKTGAIVTDTSYILNGGPMCSYFASYVGGESDTTTVSFNFGNPAYALSSGNADGNGFGNFEYAPPTGYLAWCTKNLGESG